jgi:hypothetical protein
MTQLLCCGLQDGHQWTRQASLLAVQLFPNLSIFKVEDCAIPLADLLPFLQRQPPLAAVKVAFSQLCSPNGKYDRSWPVQLLTASRCPRLELSYTYPDSKALGEPYQLSYPPLRGPHWSNTLTHLELNDLRIGKLSDWLAVVLKLPALQSFTAYSDLEPVSAIHVTQIPGGGYQNHKHSFPF